MVGLGWKGASRWSDNILKTRWTYSLDPLLFRGMMNKDGRNCHWLDVYSLKQRTWMRTGTNALGIYTNRLAGVRTRWTYWGLFMNELASYFRHHLAKVTCSTPTTARLRCFKDGERERNVLFNDALNTFYLRLYGVRHMVKDHTDSEKGNPLPPHRLLLSINSKGSFICTIPQTG